MQLSQHLSVKGSASRAKGILPSANSTFDKTGAHLPTPRLSTPTADSTQHPPPPCDGDTGARPPGHYSSAKQKAIDEARAVQASVAEECADAGKPPPPYELRELIGKGSFGRVYKAVGLGSRQAVAVKVINIDQGDDLCPGMSDTFSDILKEVNTLKRLADSGAKNVNTVVDTLLVGPTIWIVTEHCAGGSVSTLMRPTGALAERWIIPILREVAEAVFWVDSQDIIHRDIKCANVLLTEARGVQLCDFGVAGIIETKFDKRSTVTGTLQWMVPELFDSAVSYGSEVDIWAFGSMAYEMVTGLPPNAGSIGDLSQFGSYLKQHCPRLTGDQYSPQLKSLVAFCMVEDPGQRPVIEQIQRHSYLDNTSGDYPTISLSKLVSAYKVWEIQGGIRRSLFSAGGAQGPTSDISPPAITDDEWNFSTGDVEIDLDSLDAQVVYDVYGSDVEIPPRRGRWQSRRRRPPSNKAFRAPLERIFDPHTISNYDDNARAFYGRADEVSVADLPLRNNAEQPTIRESLIDLDISLDGGELSQFADLETIKNVVRPATRDGDDLDRRRTQDWTFPLTVPAFALVATLEMPPFEPHNDHEPLTFLRDSNTVYSPSAQVNGQPTGHMEPTAQLHRFSAASLIDLDAGLAIDPSGAACLSTSDSDTASSSSDLKTPFEFDSGFVPTTTREPSMYYVSGDTDTDTSPPPETHESSSLSQSKASDPRLDYHLIPRPPSWPFPPPPSASVMQGSSSQQETKDELRRMLSSLHEHILLTKSVLEAFARYQCQGQLDCTIFIGGFLDEP